MLGGPAGLLINTNTGVITWTPTEAQAGTTNLITTLVTDYSPSAVNAQRLSAANSFSVVVLGRPVITLDAAVLVAEDFLPLNNTIDPDETVTMLFALKNVGGVNTSNLVVTLLQTNGVLLASSPQSYGVLPAGGPAVSRPFTFTAAGLCGGTITPTLKLQDQLATYSALSASFTMGQAAIILSENFDTVSSPALPSGWATSASGAQSRWVTSSTLGDTLPNAAFSACTNKVGINELVSPPITLPLGLTQLSFRNRYDLEYDSQNSTVGYDGGVLEIKIGADAFKDILAAGGSFASGGYNRVISASYNSPLANRQAWSGNPGAYVTTLVNLPAAAAGKTIQFRWQCGMDNGGTSRTGWRIDTIKLSGYVCAIIPPPPVIKTVGLSNGTVTVTWSAVAGHTYRLQSIDGCTNTNWVDCSPEVHATGPTATATNATGSVMQQFYRVYLLP